MKITRTDEVSLAPDDFVTVTEMNHIVEVQHMTKMNSKAHIKKLDKDHYVVIETGEIKEFQHSENRQGNYNSLRQTFKKLRYLINNNFVGSGNELHVTLTYKKNMTDTKQLYKDFKNFIERLRTYYKNEGSIDYLAVMEPQGRGAWHGHVLMRFNDLDKVFVKNKDMKDLWGHGFVTIKSLKEVDNIGAYLSAYLADVELTEDNFVGAVVADGEVQIKEVEGKRYIKGGRLHMYPSGMNLYRKSKGIIPPERQGMYFENIKKVVGAATPHYQKAIHIEDDEKDFETTISYLQYNKKRL